MDKIEDYMHLVDVTIKRQHHDGRLFIKNLKLEKDDVRQIGMIGLVKGFKSFNKKIGKDIKTHLIASINYELKNFYRNNNYLINFSRKAKEIGRKIYQLNIDSIDEIKKMFNCSKLLAEQALNYKKYLEEDVISLDSKINNDGREIIEQLNYSHFNLENYVIRKIEAEHRLSYLSERQKLILFYTIKGKYQRDIGKILNISQKTVSKEMNKAIEILNNLNEEEEDIVNVGTRRIV